MKFSLWKIQDLKQLVKELGTGLNRISFSDNFESFEIEETIAATTELKVRNQLDPYTPSGMLILKQTGNSLVTAGDTTWDSNYVYVENRGANPVTVKIRFFK
jgi:hypothetical protein